MNKQLLGKQAQNNSMLLFDTIHAFVKNHNLINHNQTIIIGLSGGPDSVFLTHLSVSLKPLYNLTLVAAHLDHGWRAESAGDVLFCKNLSEKLGIPFVSQQLASLPLSLKYNGSKEEIGRKARRYFLEQVATDYNAHAIALGHHAHDQQETFFIRLVRGASLTGLTGMKPQEKQYIRPLLTTNKQAIIAYLEQENIPFIIDASNDQDIYLRNRIRKSVLPALQACDDRFDANFMNTLQRIQEAEAFLEQYVATIFSELAQQDQKLTVQYQQIFDQHPTISYRLILHWLCLEKIPFTPSESFFNEIMRFLSSKGGGKHQLHPSWIIVKKKNLAWVEKIH